jgi:hypothetical protein
VCDGAEFASDVLKGAEAKASGELESLIRSSR